MTLTFALCCPSLGGKETELEFHIPCIGEAPRADVEMPVFCRFQPGPQLAFYATTLPVDALAPAEAAWN